MRHLLSLAAALVLVSACAASKPAPESPSNTASNAADEDESWGDEDEDAADVAAANENEAAAAPASAGANAGPCPANMVLVAEGNVRVCVDKYEASLIEVAADGTEKAHPHWQPVDGHTVRAVSVAGVFPQGYISEVQAEDACTASGKRLCSHTEWKTACMGPSKTNYPYGAERKTGVCNDNGKSAVAAVFGYQRLADPVSPAIAKANAPKRPASTISKKASETSQPRKVASAASGKKGSRGGAKARPGREPSAPVAKQSAKTVRASSSVKHSPARASTRPSSVEASVWAQLNDPRLGQVEGGLSLTGSHASCESGFGTLDMMGNIHEWVKTDASLPHGTFAGGYFLDTSINGEGCQYKTGAHAHDYHDYSTGFRCCAEPQK